MHARLFFILQEFPAGKQILSQGQKQEHAFFITEGMLKYYVNIRTHNIKIQYFLKNLVFKKQN